jgi:peptide/nickel transport system permease protein
VGSYVVRRVLCAALLFLGPATVTFVIFFLIPHQTPVPRRRAPFPVGPPLGIHGGVLREFGSFLAHIARGDLGRSTVNGHDVWTIVIGAAPATISLVIGGAVIWIAIAIPLGLLSALRPASRAAKAGRGLALVGLSVQPLWLGLLLSWLFGVKLGWFPAGGYCAPLAPDPDCGGPIVWAHHMILPWTAFALIYGAFYVRLIRRKASARLRDDDVLTARAKGVPEWAIMRSHVLTTTVQPVLSALVLDVGGLAFGFVGVSMFVEIAFGIPGLGRTMAQAAARDDLPVLIGVILFVAATVAIANLAADLAAVLFDPRLRGGQPSQRENAFSK